jgi:hypothetical protein
MPLSATKTDPLASSSPLVEYNNSLYYQANYNNIGNELWSLKDTILYNHISQTQLWADCSIYPNPCYNSFTIRNEKSYFPQGTILNIYNLLGQVIKSETLNGQNETVIRVDNVPKGVYIVKISTGDIEMTRRLAIE